jgi:broad specificity phosphatase PhoE
VRARPRPRRTDEVVEKKRIASSCLFAKVYFLINRAGIGKRMKFVSIVYFTHGTTTHDEKGIATGWSPGELSELGRKQSIELGESIRNSGFDVVFCSDLKRAVDTAVLMFRGHVNILQDGRLREINLGDLTNTNSRKIDSIILKHINKPFPNGESCTDVEKRISSFLNDLLKKYAGKNLAIISHRVPQLALEVLINDKSWEQAVTEDWRRKQPNQWKPGWKYEFKKKPWVWGKVLSFSHTNSLLLSY